MRNFSHMQKSCQLLLSRNNSSPLHPLQGRLITESHLFPLRIKAERVPHYEHFSTSFWSKLSTSGPPRLTSQACPRTADCHRSIVHWSHSSTRHVCSISDLEKKSHADALFCICSSPSMEPGLHATTLGWQTVRLQSSGLREVCLPSHVTTNAAVAQPPQLCLQGYWPTLAIRSSHMDVSSSFSLTWKSVKNTTELKISTTDVYLPCTKATKIYKAYLQPNTATEHKLYISDSALCFLMKRAIFSWFQF